MNSKLVGAILLIVGTTIGAGMLALPVATAEVGFWGSIGLLLVCWAVMTACAFLFLEVNLWLPPNSNLISMAGATLGKPGQVVAWLFYLLLLYSILSAYVAGGGDLFGYVLTSWGLPISASIAAIFFTLAFGAIVYFGIRVVDYTNRGLMFGKLGSLILLVIVIAPFVTMHNLDQGQLVHIASSTPIMVTAVAFTCAMIIPSLRTYFNEDVKSLRKAIFIGMLIPLLCYIAWDMVIMGVIPLGGSPGLREIMRSPNSNSDLVSAITTILDSGAITIIVKFFTSICMVTSFLSVSLSLSDFLSDGLRVPKKGIKGNALVLGVTFIPPLAVVLFYPDAFLRGLQYAGLSVFVLMVLLPSLMVWRGRKTFGSVLGAYRVPGGKFLLVLIAIFGTLLVGSTLEIATWLNFAFA
jgi:tyrosine-specific transport protein